jgi:hypothetical protein
MFAPLGNPSPLRTVSSRELFVNRAAVVQYLSRRYCFTAVCIRKDDGSYEATLSRRSPGLAQSSEPGTLGTTPVAEDERFSSPSRFGAMVACRRRILELGGEILGEIATDEDNP